MQDRAEIRPIEQLEALRELLRDIPFEVHYPGDSDQEYTYLREGAACVTVLDPYQDKKLFIDLGEEFTLTYGTFHCHYDPEDYEELVSDILGILQNDICSATLYCGEEREWLGSTCVTREDLSRPVEEVFRFVLKSLEFRRKLRDFGGEARFCFWDPADDRVVEIPTA